KGSILGKKDQYKSDVSGNIGINLSSTGVGKVESGGDVNINYTAGTWKYAISKGYLKATIDEVFNLEAKGITYDNTNESLAFETASVIIPELNETSVKVEKAQIDKNGIDWDKITVKTKDIKLGEFASVGQPTATIGGKSQQYKLECAGAVAVNIGSKEIVNVKSSGDLKIIYQSGKWDYESKNLSLSATIADILNFEAKGINYDHEKKSLTLSQASITIPELKNISAEAKNVRIDHNGIDWDKISVPMPEIPLGEIVKIKESKASIEGAKQKYSTIIGGGLELKFGDYFQATGTGAVKLDRTVSPSQLKIESAKLEAQGKVELPGKLMVWPSIDFSYPIVPGLEAGVQLGIKGGIEGALKGAIAKNGTNQDWDFAVNPEIKGYLAVSLKAFAGVGSAYIASLQAYIEGLCRADAIGGLQFSGKFGYDESTKKINASKLTSKYYAEAKFTAEIAAGIQAQAFYFFKKNLYRITIGKWELGSGNIGGDIKIDEDGKLKVSSPTFGGVMKGEIEKNGTGPKGEIIAVAEAQKLLRDAAQSIEGSGEERQAIIKKIEVKYKEAIKVTQGVIDKEVEKSDKCVDQLDKINKKLSRYSNVWKKLNGDKNEPIKKRNIIKQVASGIRHSDSVHQAKEILNEGGTTLRGRNNKDYLSNKIKTASDLWDKISDKYDVHYARYQDAVAAIKQSVAVLADVEAAIQNIQALEQGKGIENISTIEKEQKILDSAQEKLKEESIKLDISSIEKQVSELEDIET
ncbi:hypothetical protein QHH03_00895, partial [Aphanizomenon sp. 202]|nr:hypothetical protein [Aphanizomenon sp. 202]